MTTHKNVVKFNNITIKDSPDVICVLAVWVTAECSPSLETVLCARVGQDHPTSNPHLQEMTVVFPLTGDQGHSQYYLTHPSAVLFSAQESALHQDPMLVSW